MTGLLAIICGMIADVRRGIRYIRTFEPGVDWSDPRLYEPKTTKTKQRAREDVA